MINYKVFSRLFLLILTIFYLNGCGGSSTPKDDSNITEVNTTVAEETEQDDLIPIEEDNLIEINISEEEIDTAGQGDLTSLDDEINTSEDEDPVPIQEDNTTIEEIIPPKEEEKQEDVQIDLTPKEENNTTDDNSTVEEIPPVKEENNETQEEIEEEEPVVIPNTPPVVDAKEDKSIEVNQNITITAEATDNDGEIVSQRWSDEANNTLSSELSFEYSNTEVGLYTLTFSATDDNGSSASDTMDLNVTEVVEECDPLAELLGAC